MKPELKYIRYSVFNIILTIYNTYIVYTNIFNYYTVHCLKTVYCKNNALCYVSIIPST
jgi:hypothetical protein